jgi:phosphonate transport system substrate-binding protein
MNKYTSTATASYRRTPHYALLALLGALTLAAAGCTGGDGASNERPQAHAEESTTSVSNAAATRESTKSVRQLSFGLYQTDKPTEIYKRFRPITNYLSDAISKTVGEPVKVQLRILRSYDAGLDAIVNGDVDFMRLGPASYVLARERNPNVQLLAMESKKGKKRSPGVIVVRRDSRYQTLQDLKGASFAFGDPNSTIGRFLAQEQLVLAGIDAGSLKIGTLKKINKKGELRIIAKFDNVTKPWVARADLPEPMVGAIQAALLGVEDENVLRTLGVSAFAESSDEEYAFVRAGMKRAEAFDE